MRHSRFKVNLVGDLSTT